MEKDECKRKFRGIRTCGTEESERKIQQKKEIGIKENKDGAIQCCSD